MKPGRALTLAVAAALAPTWSTASGAGLGALDPTQAPAGAPGATLRVLGTGLLPGSVVCWRGAARPTTSVGLLEVRAQLSGADLASPGSAAVTVALPPLLGTAACGLGSLLGPLTFAITAPVPVPAPDPPPGTAPPPGSTPPAPVPPGITPPAPAPPGTGPPAPRPPTPRPVPGLPLPPAIVGAPGAVLGAVAAIAGLGGAAGGAQTLVTGLVGGGMLPGDLLRIDGRSFGKRVGALLVRGRRAAIVSWSPTRIVAVLPALAPGPANVQVLVDRRPVAAPTIQVSPAPEQPPIANPVVLPAVGAGFAFDATLSIDPEGFAPAPGTKAEHGLAAGIRSVLWNFGDGTTSTRPVLTKTYARPGSYRVTLTVTDAAGRTGTSSQTVTVAPASAPRTARPRPRNIRIPSMILFDFGSDGLRPESRALLRRVSKVVRRGMGPARVVGHTDATGPARFNLDLSHERALVVRSYLVRRGPVEGRRLRAVGRGEVRPLASNLTERGRQLNRRVVIRLRLPSVGVTRI